ncbi:MAG: DUF4320 family protein [Clostridiales Family XIII bacterium]|jgi:hypothetical protein|nr:DUF4320 family protein [Clostridiales Family XIII bacterium]
MKRLEKATYPMRAFPFRKGVASYIGLAVMMIIFSLALMVVITVTPVFTAKQNLDLFAGELVRTAEISGEVGAETTERAAELKSELDLSPDIAWSRTGRVPLGEKVLVTLTLKKKLEFSAFAQPVVTLESRASGRSEVYWK